MSAMLRFGAENILAEHKLGTQQTKERAIMVKEAGRRAGHLALSPYITVPLAVLPDTGTGQG